MFKVINPFVLASQLLDDNDSEFRVESIRSSTDGNIRLGLRSVSRGVPSSRPLSHVLNWRIYIEGKYQKTVLGHLESCYMEISQWLGKVARGQLRERPSAWKNLTIVPPCFNREGLLPIGEAGGSLPSRDKLVQWLNEDRKVWQLTEKVPPGISSGQSFSINPWKVKTHLELIESVVSAARAARRLYSGTPNIADENALLESCVVVAVEEYCLLCVRESLQHLDSLDKKKSLREHELSCIVTVESAAKASRKHIRVEECTDGSVRITLLCLATKEMKVFRVALRNTFDTFNLYGDLRREHNNKESILDEGMTRLKISLNALRLPQSLRFSNLQKLQEWLDTKLNPADPEFTSSLRAILRWVKGGYRGLPKENQAAAREAVGAKESELIALL